MIFISSINPLDIYTYKTRRNFLSVSKFFSFIRRKDMDFHSIDWSSRNLYTQFSFFRRTNIDFYRNSMIDFSLSRFNKMLDKRILLKIFTFHGWKIIAPVVDSTWILSWIRSWRMLPLACGSFSSRLEDLWGRGLKAFLFRRTLPVQIKWTTLAERLQSDRKTPASHYFPLLRFLPRDDTSFTNTRTISRIFIYNSHLVGL